jgi:alpha-L-fucosidase
MGRLRTIDDQEVDIVKQIGGWMKVNGEAIYATRPWKVCGEGPSIDNAPAIKAQGFNEGKVKMRVDDVRYTTKGNILYALVLSSPTKQVTLKSLSTAAGLLDGSIQKIELLGSDEKVEWAQAPGAVTIQPPKTKLANAEATVFKMSLKP